MRKAPLNNQGQDVVVQDDMSCTLYLPETTGMLAHPAQTTGVDVKFLVDYWETVPDCLINLATAQTEIKLKLSAPEYRYPIYLSWGRLEDLQTLIAILTRMAGHWEVIQQLQEAAKNGAKA